MTLVDPAVAKVFAEYPPVLRKRLLAARKMIFEVAKQTEGVGPLQETLEWGEPAYLTAESGSGTTIRINRHNKQSGQYVIYFNCQTTLVDTFRSLFPGTFRFEGNRAIVFDVTDRVPAAETKLCIAMALTYHRDQRSASAAKRESVQRSASRKHRLRRA